mmetsp:Transcript_108061/g.220634  ORF Transcript_108061/g.220634 Transcript_108061/m.220634 type:complete len:227 (+) Transcript_108061:674-1354(+)
MGKASLLFGPCQCVLLRSRNPRLPIGFRDRIEKRKKKKKKNQFRFVPLIASPMEHPVRNPFVAIVLLPSLSLSTVRALFSPKRFGDRPGWSWCSSVGPSWRPRPAGGVHTREARIPSEYPPPSLGRIAAVAFLLFAFSLPVCVAAPPLLPRAASLSPSFAPARRSASTRPLVFLPGPARRQHSAIPRMPRRESARQRSSTPSSVAPRVWGVSPSTCTSFFPRALQQ